MRLKLSCVHPNILQISLKHKIKVLKKSLVSYYYSGLSKHEESSEQSENKNENESSESENENELEQCKECSRLLDMQHDEKIVLKSDLSISHRYIQDLNGKLANWNKTIEDKNAEIAKLTGKYNSWKQEKERHKKVGQEYSEKIKRLSDELHALNMRHLDTQHKL